MKRLLCLLLVLALSLSTFPVLAADSTRDLSLKTQVTNHLNSLGLCLRVGENKDGSTNFDLNPQSTRVEAAAMLLYTLGKVIPHRLPNYQTELAKAKVNLLEIYQTLETERCTIVFGRVAGGERIYLIYKLADSKNPTPMQQIDGPAGGKLHLSANQDFFYYTHAVSEDSMPNIQPNMIDTLPQSNALLYTVDIFSQNIQVQLCQGGSLPQDLESPHEQAMYKKTAYADSVLRLLDNPYGTLLLSSQAVMHGGSQNLLFFAKAKNPLEPDWQIYVPLSPTAFMSDILPEHFTLSPDGKTLSYFYFFEERQALSWNGSPERVIHEAGTYFYSLDLPTGKVTEHFTPK